MKDKGMNIDHRVGEKICKRLDDIDERTAEEKTFSPRLSALLLTFSDSSVESHRVFSF